MSDQTSWPTTIAANRAELLSYLGTGACLESYRATNIAWVITGVPSPDYNGVIWPRLTEEEAEQLGPILVDRFRMHQLPALWHFDAATQPADLGERLERLGCRPSNPALSMAATIVDVTRGMRDLPHLTVERVTTPEELAIWMEVWGEVTGEARSPREDLYASLGLKRVEPLRHYLARLDRRPVGVCQLYLGQQAAGLYALGVNPGFRRFGVGRVLAQWPLLEARTLGYDLAVASPPETSRPFFEALGLKAFPSPYPAYTIWP
jgi:GNAT superfamily N-acetyltransferase